MRLAGLAGLVSPLRCLRPVGTLLCLLGSNEFSLDELGVLLLLVLHLFFDSLALLRLSLLVVVLRVLLSDLLFEDCEVCVFSITHELGFRGGLLLP